MLAVELFDNTLLFLSGLGTLSVAVGMGLHAWRHVGRIIPWWWWILNGFFVGLASAANEGLMQAALFVVGGLSFGVGLAILIPSYLAGEIRLHRNSWAEGVVAKNAADGAKLIVVMEVKAAFQNLANDEASFEFTVGCVNSSVHRALLDFEVKGSIHLWDGTQIARAPEICKIRRLGEERELGPPYKDVELWFDQADWFDLTLRQYLTSPTAEKLIAKKGRGRIWFGFDHLDIGVRFSIPDRDGRTFALGDRGRIQLPGINLGIPG
jgi:hypothetical protein